MRLNLFQKLSQQPNDLHSTVPIIVHSTTEKNVTYGDHYDLKKTSHDMFFQKTTHALKFFDDERKQKMLLEIIP